MKLYDELYFEITLEGRKSDLKNFVKFIRSGELDDFFEITSDYIVYNDDYATAEDEAETGLVFTNDDIGIEISSFSPEDFLDTICKAMKNLEVSGHFYDIDDEEYTFRSPKGDAGYADGAIESFNDELDERAKEEDFDDE